MRKILLFCLLPGIVLPGNAQSIVWDGSQDKLILGDRVALLEDPGGELDIEAVSTEYADAFTPSDQVILNFGFSRSAHWFRFELQNTTSEKLWLELAQAYLPEADLYYTDERGDWQVLEAGYQVDLREKPVKHNYQVFPLPAEARRIYLRFYAYSHPVPVKLWEEEAYQMKTTRQKLIYGLYTGLLIFVILNNIFLFFSLRKRIYLHYAFLVLSYLGVAGFVMEGYFQYLFPTADLMYWFLLIPTITGATALLYCISFVEVKKYDPKIYKLALGIGIYYVAYIFFRHLFPDFLAIQLNQHHSVVVLFLQGFLGIRAGLRGNKFGYYYSAAYFIYFVAVIIEVIYIQSGSPKHILELSFVSLGTLIEVFLLAYALSKRFEWEKKQIEKAKDEAQRELLKQTRENERMALEQNQRLQEIDKLKDQFLANTSHELRTPLNGIIGLSESLQERTTDPAQREDLELITSSGKRLSSLVNDLLDFSKLKNYDIQLQEKALDLHTMVEVVLKVFHPLIGNKKLKLRNEIPKDLKAVQADENRLQQILHNLIGNAIKFTSVGEVRVQAREESNLIRIEVIDTGIGISEEKQKTIFQAFQQADGSISRDFGGTGLGLSISRQLVHLHGGEIGVESKVGSGSTFWFTLPATAEQGEKVGPAPGISSIEAPAATAPEIKPRTPKDGDKPSVRILIVDDEPINQKVLQNHLSDFPFHLDFASNGQDALRLIADNPPYDLVLLDVMMPRMSGYEVCEKIRQEYLPSELPIIMVTAKNQVMDLVQGLQMGANDYLPKPFSKPEFLARVRTHLDLHRIFQVTGKFVPNEFIRSLGKDRITEVELGDNAQRQVTVLFSDIRDYTGISEKMTPEENFGLVRTYNGLMGPIIQQHRGFIHQYLGDGIMAIFPEHPEDALRAAVAMQQSLLEYNTSRIKKGRLPLQVGMGIHTGPLIMGIIGDKNRLEVATIADTVNTASRIENLTKYYRSQILISEEVFQGLDRAEDFHFRYLGQVQVKGKQKAVGIYECLDGFPPEDLERKITTTPFFKKALSRYFTKDFSGARASLERALEQNPGDPVLLLFLERARLFEKTGVPDTWTGIETMRGKF